MIVVCCRLHNGVALFWCGGDVVVTWSLNGDDVAAWLLSAM